MEIIRLAAPVVVGIALIITGGVVLNTWLKMKHGYPLNSSWGQKLYPKTSSEEVERIKLLSQETLRCGRNSAASKTGSAMSSGS